MREARAIAPAASTRARGSRAPGLQRTTRSSTCGAGPPKVLPTSRTERKPPMKRPKSDYVILAVRNALRVLEAFRDEGQLGVTELARRLGLHKNNVFRILATLEQQGYVEQCGEHEAYRLGVRCLQLGRSYADARSLLRTARPVLEALA